MYFYTLICIMFVNARTAYSHNNEELRKNVRLLTLHIPPYIMVQWNSSNGHVSHVNGLTTHFLEWISHRFNFTYTWLPVGRNLLVEDSPKERGLISYLTNNEADAVISALTPSGERHEFVDFTAPVSDIKVSILIPSLTQSSNQKAIMEPFRAEVWITLLVSLILMIGFLYLTSLATDIVTMKAPIRAKTNYHTNLLSNCTEYVVSVLLNQGGYRETRAAAFRLIAAVWCLAAFVLIPAYSGKLTSHLMSPNIMPIIKSIYDIPSVPGLKLAVNRGFGADLAFTSYFSKDNSTLLGRMSVEFIKTILRCNTTDACLDGVRSGQYVFVQADKVINNIIIEERRRIGRCGFAMAQESILAYYLTFAITQKKSPYLHQFDKGILEMEAMGIAPYWRAKYLFEAKDCNKPTNSLRLRPFSIIEFASTFILFGVGCTLAFLALVIELMSSMMMYKLK